MSGPSPISPTDIVVPRLGESITEGVVAKWLKQVGEALTADEPVVEIETDKVTLTLPSPSAGVLSEQLCAEGATVKVGEVVARIAAAPEVPIAARPPSAAPPAPTGSRETPDDDHLPSKRVVETPIAEPARGTNAALHNGPPSHARTLPPSVRKAIREGAPPHPEDRGGGVKGEPTPVVAVETRPAAPGGPEAPAAVADAAERVVPMSSLRRRIAQRLVEAQHTAAILTTFNEVDMSAVMALRARFQEGFVAKHGVKLGFMSLFVRACVDSLKQFPGLNAELRGDAIVYKQRYDLGIAVGSGRGLVVPVVRGADGLSLAAIEKAIGDLGSRARDGKLTLDDLTGGTFTITNGGIYGSMMSTPLLNMPQTGILGMHNIIRRPVAVGDAIALRPMMYLALSYDHRVVDGREAVQFLVAVKERIEAPERLMLEI